METQSRPKRGAKAVPIRVGSPDHEFTPDEVRLRTRVIEHYAWVATWDRAYAIEGYRRSKENMPWLKL